MVEVLVLMNHKLTEEQIANLGDMFNTQELGIYYPNDNVKALWSQIPANADMKELKQYLKPIKDWLDSYNLNQVHLICMGETSASFLIRNYFLNNGGKSILDATSRREVIEVTNPDGSVTKKAIFKHIRFREITKKDLGWI